MFTVRVFLLFTVVFLSTEFGKCDSFMSKPFRGTYISPMEKLIQMLIKSKESINENIVTVKNNVKNLVSNIVNSTRERSTFSNILNPFKLRIKAIFPGTYWCGAGNISPNEEDVGWFNKTDTCCKAHDLCPENILVGEERDDLINNGVFTRSSCECDTAFYQCLKMANTVLASNIGVTYFNVLRPQCFQKSYPIVGCNKRTGRRLISNKCEEYIYNTNLPQILQWLDNPDF